MTPEQFNQWLGLQQRQAIATFQQFEKFKVEPISRKAEQLIR